MDISRPTASTAVSKAKTTILIGVTKDNTVHIDRRQVDVRAVRANVERAMAENPEGSVVIVADRESPDRPCHQRHGCL